jgi:hypothetical protein
MPDLVFIGDLANAGALDGTERVPMDKSAATVDASTQEIANLATKATVGLANVDNTSDANKPVSTATQTALGLKANSSGTLAQFAATTSAQLLGVISDETGTGSLVFATSPTLVTPALGTPASGTLTNCTGLPFAAGVSNKPTTLSGYGITDAVDSSDARLSNARTPTAHIQAASTISDSTAAGRALLTAADAAAQRTSLGLGDLATQSGTFSGTSSGTNTGDQTITLTGDVTGSGTGSFAATVANSAVIGKVITGFTSGAGTVAATDTILQAIQKLNGNIAASTGLPASLTADGSNNLTLTARWTQSTNGAASAPPHSLTGTWFTGGTSTTTKPQFLIEPAGTTSNNWSTLGTGFGVNAPAGFAGNLLDLQIGGARQFTFGSDVSIQGGNDTFEIKTFSTNSFEVWINNIRSFQLNWNTGLKLNTQWGLNWASGADVNTTVDLSLQRDGANILAQRNGTNAQTSRLYNTYTSDTNFERAKIEWASNTLRIGTEKGSAGGTARDMELQTNGTTRITVKDSGAIIFSGIPTSNPNVAGQLWNDGGTLKISA